MRHVSLKIEKRGYVLNIPGTSTVRSPCSIDISKLNITQVLNSLNSIGIVDFIIVSKDVKSKDKNLNITKSNDEKLEILLETKVEQPEIKQQEVIIDYSNQLKEIDSKLNVILENMLSSTIVNSSLKVDKMPIDEEQIFIPNANIEGMTITQGNMDSSKMDSLDSSVNALKNIKKSKKKQ